MAENANWNSQLLAAQLRWSDWEPLFHAVKQSLDLLQEELPNGGREILLDERGPEYVAKLDGYISQIAEGKVALDQFGQMRDFVEMVKEVQTIWKSYENAATVAMFSDRME